MNKLGRFVSGAVAATIAAAAACGGDSTGAGPQAASVTGIAGDSQVDTVRQTPIIGARAAFLALRSSFLGVPDGDGEHARTGAVALDPSFEAAGPRARSPARPAGRRARRGDGRRRRRE